MFKIKIVIKRILKFSETGLMTWIIASPTMFGYGVGVSDIRVTLRDGTTRDCLQKIYKVGADIAIGFAGSVSIGFNMVDELREFLSDLPEGNAWKPDWVATEWQPIAKQIYSSSPEEEQKGGCSLILLGSSPNETLGDMSFAKTVVAILQAPDFKPMFVKIGQWDGIGSGMGISGYKDIVAELNKDDYSFRQMEVGMQRGFGFAIQILITQTIAKIPEKSVSRYVHLCTVRPREVKITGINSVEYKQDENKSYNMPKVATSWNELKEALGVEDKALVGSSCK